MSKSALLRNLPPEKPSQQQQQQQQQQQPQPAPGTSGGGEEEEAGGGGGGGGGGGEGAEKSNKNNGSWVGIAVAPWLRWAALREAEDELASHAAAPHMRKRWKCPSCGISMMAGRMDVDESHHTMM